MLTIAEIAKALNAVASLYDIRAAYLFGSYARGEARPESDVDLRLECGPDVGYGELLDVQERMESLLERPVELVTNPLEHMRPAFRERVTRDEVLLYAAA